MSDPGNVNGTQIDDPVPNSFVVGVDVVSGAGNEPVAAATGSGSGGGYDPEGFTIDEVKAYVDKHPDQRDAVWDAELAGKNRTTLVAWLEESE